MYVATTFNGSMIVGRRSVSTTFHICSLFSTGQFGFGCCNFAVILLSSFVSSDNACAIFCAVNLLGFETFKIRIY